MRTSLALAALLAGVAVALAAAQTANLDGYAADAKAADPAFAGFSAARGRALFLSKPGTGKPDTPGCTTCHTEDPKAVGHTRAGKEIAPMAVSLSPQRFTEREKTEKWFGRNCDSVLGRACTPTEKGDFITFMMTQ